MLTKIGSKYTVTIDDNYGHFEIELKGIRFAGLDNIRALVSIVYSDLQGNTRRFASPVIISQPSRLREFVRMASDILVTNEQNLLKIFSLLSHELINELYSIQQPAHLELVDDSDTNFIVDNFILENLLTLVFARGGSGKSFVALLAGLAVQNADSLPEDFPFKANKRTNVLYLDWESDKLEMDRRFTKMVNGMQLDGIYSPLYVSVVRPLEDVIDDISIICATNDIGMVIVDSVGLASGGSIEDTSTSINFFRAVRQLTDDGISVFAVTHMSKRALESQDFQTPIGSIYYENMPRLIWQVNSDILESETHMQFIVRKSNVGKLPSFGLTLSFFDNSVSIIKENHPELEVTGGERDVTDFVIELLKENSNGLSIGEIVKEAGSSKEEVKRILDKLKAQNKVKYASGKWKWQAIDEIPF